MWHTPAARKTSITSSVPISGPGPAAHRAHGSYSRFFRSRGLQLCLRSADKASDDNEFPYRTSRDSSSRGCASYGRALAWDQRKTNRCVVEGNIYRTRVWAGDGEYDNHSRGALRESIACGRVARISRVHVDEPDFRPRQPYAVWRIRWAASIDSKDRKSTRLNSS